MTLSAEDKRFDKHFKDPESKSCYQLDHDESNTSLVDQYQYVQIDFENYNPSVESLASYWEDVEFMADTGNSIKSLTNNEDGQSLKNNLSQQQIEELSEKLFINFQRADTDYVIDVEGKNTVMELSIGHKYDESFNDALIRMISNNTTQSNLVTKTEIIIAISQLSSGTMKEKVALLFKFMNRNGNDIISEEEAKWFFKKTDSTKLLERLSELCNVDGKSDLRISFDNLYTCFSRSRKGKDAINMFCSQVIGHLQDILNISKVKESKSVPGVNEVQANAVESVFDVMKEKISRVSKATRMKYALVFVNICLWIYYFAGPTYADKPIPFRIAKGFGLSLRILTIFMFLTMTRSFSGFLYNFSILQPFIPMGYNIEIHSFSGMLLTINSFGHVLGHIVYESLYLVSGVEGSFMESLMKFQNGEVFCGWILVGILFAMVITALNRGNNSIYYKVFYYVHYLYVAWIVVLILHVILLWPYFVAIGSLMLLERAYDFFRLTTVSTLELSRPFKEDVIFLSVPAPFSTVPGTYYRIKVPAISSVEWHPFSLASSVSSNQLTFFISSVGDWTKSLHAIVSDPELRKVTKILVQGPFVAPAQTAARSTTETILLVAAGIGITPFFSVMATKVTDAQIEAYDRELFRSLFDEDVTPILRKGRLKNESKSKNLLKAFPVSTTKSSSKKYKGNFEKDTFHNISYKPIRVAWSVRDVSGLLVSIDYVYQLVKQQEILHERSVYVDIYLTGLGHSSDPAYMVSQTLYLMIVGEKTGEFMDVHFRRMDATKVINDAKATEVYYCGGNILKNVFDEACAKSKIKFHPESFDEGTTILNNAIKSIQDFVTTAIGYFTSK